MKIILINPPPLFSDGSFNPIQNYYPPLGLLYIAAVLEKAGYEVSICDASVNNMSFEQIRKELHEDYNIIGITTFSGTRESAYLCASIAKERNRGAIVVLGGPHVTFLPEVTLRELPFVDIVVRGEGESTFLELVQRISTGKSYEDVKGISFRNGNGVPCSNPDRETIDNLDLLPLPARHLVPMSKYFKASPKQQFCLKMPATTVITSRGCPGNCIFCSTPGMWGRRVRRRTPENVIKEIEYLHKEYGINDIFFMDDTFTLNKKWVMRFCDGLIQSKTGISWRCLGRVDTVDADFLTAMKKAGCYHVNYGIESGSAKTQKLIQKHITIEQATEAIKLTKEAGLFVGADFIIGFPDETEEDIEQTFLLIKKLPLNNFALNVPWIFPGTALYRHALEEGKIDEMTWFKPFQPLKSPGVQPSFPIYASDNFPHKGEILSLAQTKMWTELLTCDFLKRRIELQRHTLPLTQFISSALPGVLFTIVRIVEEKLSQKGGIFRIVDHRITNGIVQSLSILRKIRK